MQATTGGSTVVAEHAFDAGTLVALMKQLQCVAPSTLPVEEGPADVIVITQAGGGRPATVWHTLRQLADRLAKEHGCTVADVEILVRVRALENGQREETYRVRRKHHA